MADKPKQGSTGHICKPGEQVRVNKLVLFRVVEVVWRVIDGEISGSRCSRVSRATHKGAGARKATAAAEDGYRSLNKPLGPVSAVKRCAKPCSTRGTHTAVFTTKALMLAPKLVLHDDLFEYAHDAIKRRILPNNHCQQLNTLTAKLRVRGWLRMPRRSENTSTHSL
jgi:hypothetical protein